PKYQRPGTSFALTEGLYILSVIPDAKGIVSFVLRHQENPSSDPLAPDITATERLMRQRLLWPNLQLAASDEYLLTLNPRHDVAAGLLVRPLPLDLSDPLPVTLFPDEQVPIQIEVKQSSTLLIDSDGKASYRISGYSDPIKSGATLLPGRYTLNLTNTGSQPAFFSVRTVPSSVEPPLSQENLARRMVEARQVFPTLTETQPLFENFDRQEQRHYTLLVEQPGLYRLETSGRLATSLTVRTRFVTSLFTAQSNGIGRNALVQQYLRPGEYQVTVQTAGQSKGRAGVHLRRVPLTEEAGLAPGISKKIYLRADEAVRYRFDIAADGNYRLRTLGLQKQYAWRLEDHEGWPLVKPNQIGPIRQYFSAGTYHYFSLPDDVEGRRITTLDLIPVPRPDFEGKGPHSIALNETIEHVWREDEGRSPDRFVIFLPDPVKATVTLSDDLVADLCACDGAPPAPCSDFKLLVRGDRDPFINFPNPGYFEFQVRSLEKTDRLPYALSVTTTDLITGLRHRVNDLPAEFTVRTGDERLAELFSFGEVDVKATLTDSAGKVVAVSDDQPNDWNFRISQKLQPGVYTLRLQPIGEHGDGELEVAMTKRDEVEFPAAAFPFTLDADIQDDVGSIAFTTADDAGLARIRVEGNDLVKLALYQEKRLLTEGDRELWLPLRPSQAYTLVFWRDTAGLLTDVVGPLKLAAAIFPAQELDLSDGALEFEIPNSGAETVAFKLAHGDKQSYMLKSRYPLRFSAQPEAAFSAVADVPVVMPDAAGWLLVDFRPGQSSQNTLSITPFALAKPTEAVALGQAGLPFDLEQTSDVPVLLEITSICATIGAVVADRDIYADQLINWPGMARSPSQTLIALAGAGAYRGRLWATTDAPVNGKVLLSRREFPQATHLELHPSGQHEGRIPGGEAHIFSIAAVPQIFDLLLSKDLVAFA
ncbi:MAG: hypothetical protein R6X05_11330, partial [Desulfobacterales bacterium]